MLVIRTALTVLALAVAVGYSVYWNRMASAVLDGVDGWVARQETRDPRVGAARLDVGGFPVRFRAEAEDFLIRPADGLVVEGARLSVTAPPWLWPTISFRLDGPHRLTADLGDGTDAVVAAAEGAGEVRLDRDGQVVGAALSLTDLSGRAAALEQPAGAAALHLAATLPFSATGGADPRAYAVEGGIDGLRLPIEPLPGMGTEIAAADIALDVHGAIDHPSAAGLLAWREAGGRLRVRRLHLSYGPLEVEAEGELGLDAELRPEGELIARITGHEPVLDALLAAGHIDQGTALGVRLGLGLLAEPPGPDGRRWVRAVLPIVEGELRFIGFPVAQLPPVVDPPWRGEGRPLNTP